MDWGNLGAAGLNAFAGWLKNRKGARTGEFDRSSTTSGTTTRTRTLRPEQEAGMSLLDKRMHALLNDPEAGMGQMFSGARASVNRRYSGAPQMLADRMLRHGQGSGKFGRATRQMEMSRLGDLSALEPIFAQMILEQKDKGVGIAERLLSQDFGGSVSTTSAGRQWGTDTRPGSAAAGAVSGGAEALTMLMMLDKMMQGQGGSSSGGSYTPDQWPGGGG